MKRSKPLKVFGEGVCHAAKTSIATQAEGRVAGTGALGPAAHSACPGLTLRACALGLVAVHAGRGAVWLHVPVGADALSHVEKPALRSAASTGGQFSVFLKFETEKDN